MKITIFYLLLLTFAENCFAALTETTLSCRVETELRNGTVAFNKKTEVITLEIMQNNEFFVIGGTGDIASVFATNDSRTSGKLNINDKSTASKFEVDFSSESFDEKNQKIHIDDFKFRLDRVSGTIYSSRTYKAMSPKANAITTGNCQKANKKF
jgi:hypothetical protein